MIYQHPISNDDGHRPPLTWSTLNIVSVGISMLAIGIEIGRLS